MPHFFVFETVFFTSNATDLHLYNNFFRHRTCHLQVTGVWANWMHGPCIVQTTLVTTVPITDVLSTHLMYSLSALISWGGHWRWHWQWGRCRDRNRRWGWQGTRRGRGRWLWSPVWEMLLSIHTLVQLISWPAARIQWAVVAITKPPSPTLITIANVLRSTIAESLSIIFVDVAIQLAIQNLQTVSRTAWRSHKISSPRPLASTFLSNSIGSESSVSRQILRRILLKCCQIVSTRKPKGVPTMFGLVGTGTLGS